MQRHCRQLDNSTHLADEFDVLSFNVFNHHDLHFVQEVHSKVAQSISGAGQFEVNRKPLVNRHTHTMLCWSTMVSVKLRCWHT